MTIGTHARRAAAVGAVGLLMAVGLTTGAEAASGTVATPGSTLTLRSTASTGGTALVSIPHGTSLNLICKTSGTSIAGSQGTTTAWDRVSYGGKTGYVSAAWVTGGNAASVNTCGKGTVRTGGSTLTLRSTASTGGAALASIPDGAVITLQCKVAGASIAGTQGTTTTWNKVSYGGKTGYVSAAYVWGGTNSFVGNCGTTTPAPSAQWASPAPASATVTSRVGPRWGTTHRGTDIAYSGDVKSGCTGKVTGVRIDPKYPNSNTWSTGTAGNTNMVTIDCGGGVIMKYGHFYARELSSAVKVGAAVKAGQFLHPVGNQGYSTGKHLHWEVWVNGSPVDGIAFLQGKGVKGLPG